MRLSVVIAAKNEGGLLIKTALSCVDSIRAIGGELAVADDGSTDGSMEELTHSVSDVRIVRHSKTQGVSRAKHTAAASANGEVLVFLDSHCNPERGSLERLVKAVEQLRGEGIVAPRTTSLDVERWQNIGHMSGNGYALDLSTFDERWVLLSEMRRTNGYYESPNLVGCCFAISRDLYFALGGFDSDMLDWGLEQVDFGLRAWLMGHKIINDIHAVVGHRFQKTPPENEARDTRILVNKMRLARRHFTEPVWQDWCHRMLSRVPSLDRWHRAWALFTATRPSVERDRERFMSNRVHDEFWYATEFGMNWPVRAVPKSLNDGRAGGDEECKDLGCLNVRLAKRPFGGVDIEEIETRERAPLFANELNFLASVVKGRSTEWLHRLTFDHLLRYPQSTALHLGRLSALLQSLKKAAKEAAVGGTV